MLDRVVADAWRRHAPPPRLSVADWADEHRRLGRGESPVPGPWRTARTPYLRAPMDAVMDPGVDIIVLLFSSQVGKTEDLLNTLLYSYGVDPGPGMFAMPTLELAGAFSQDRLTPALRACVVLAVGTPKSRTTGDAVLHKRINGAPLTLCGANSPASLASRPVRNLWCDEIDHWPAATEEGDPLALAIQRTAAYRRRKIVLASTPTIKGASRIEDWSARSDRRRLWAPCPRCSEPFVVEWHHVRWDAGDPSSAHIECPACRGRIEDNERGAMFAGAVWRPDNPEVTRIRGFRAWAVVSPWVRLPEIVAAFLEAKKQPSTLQSWVNLTRGESWEEPAARIESHALVSRAESGDWSTLPRGVRVLTAGVDTQDDRLELLVVGWGDGEESWLVSRELFPGDPASAQPWRDLDETLQRDWPCEDGRTMRVQCTLVDCLGHRTQAVYSAVAQRQQRRVFASVGKAGGENGLLVSPPKGLTTPYGRVIRHVVDADQVKALLHSRLRIAEAGPGYVHIPSLGAELLVDELTAEMLRTERNRYGVPTAKWVKVRDRNETLDCFGLALAALRVVAPTPGRLAMLAAQVAAAGRKS